MQDDSRPKLSDLIREHEITLTFVPGAPPDPNFRDSVPWTVTLHRPGACDYTVPFYMGKGLVDQNNKKIVWVDHMIQRVLKPAEPDVLHVLDCLLSDADTVEQARTFEEWCGELGFNPNSRKAERTHRACQDIALRLRQFLGEHYETFRYAERG